MHPGKALPQVSREHAAAEGVEGRCFPRREGLALLPVGGGLAAHVSGAGKAFGHHLLLREQVGDRRHTRVHQLGLEMVEQGGRHALTSMVGIHGDAHDPGPRL